MSITPISQNPVVTTVALIQFCGSIVNVDIEDGKMMRKVCIIPPFWKGTFTKCPCFPGREKER